MTPHEQAPQPTPGRTAPPLRAQEAFRSPESGIIEPTMQEVKDYAETATAYVDSTTKEAIHPTESDVPTGLHSHDTSRKLSGDIHQEPSHKEELQKIDLEIAQLSATTKGEIEAALQEPSITIPGNPPNPIELRENRRMSIIQELENEWVQKHGPLERPMTAAERKNIQAWELMNGKRWVGGFTKMTDAANEFYFDHKNMGQNSVPTQAERILLKRFPEYATTIPEHSMQLPERATTEVPKTKDNSSTQDLPSSEHANPEDTTQSEEGPSFGKQLAHYLTGMDIADPALIERIEQDQHVVREKYSLPPFVLKTVAPAEYERELHTLAQKHNIEIRSTHDFDAFFKEHPYAGGAHFEGAGIAVDVNKNESLEEYRLSLSRLEHELIHALQAKLSPRMPIEVMEYEAYIATGNTEVLKKERGLIEMLFSMLIGGSVLHWYSTQRNKSTPPWYKKPSHELGNTASGT